MKANKLAAYNSKSRTKEIKELGKKLTHYENTNRNKCLHQDERGTRAIKKETTVNGVKYKWVCADCGEPLAHVRIEKDDLSSALTTARDTCNQIKQSLNKRSMADMTFGTRIVDVLNMLEPIKNYYIMIMYEGRKKKKNGEKLGNIRHG